MVLAVALLVPLAYLLGTFPAAVLVARAKGRDVTTEGSRNPGASNVARLLGWRFAALVLVADIGKGALAAGVGLLVGGTAGAYALGAAAVLGHVFPVTRRFRGGRGVATAGGAMLVVYPIVTVALAVVWFAIARGLKKASVASLTVAIAFPFLVALAGAEWWEVAATAGVAVLVVARHAGNLRRLVRGEELGLDPPPDGGTVSDR